MTLRWIPALSRGLDWMALEAPQGQREEGEILQPLQVGRWKSAHPFCRPIWRGLQDLPILPLTLREVVRTRRWGEASDWLL